MGITAQQLLEPRNPFAGRFSALLVPKGFEPLCEQLSRKVDAVDLGSMVPKWGKLGESLDNVALQKLFEYFAYAVPGPIQPGYQLGMPHGTYLIPIAKGLPIEPQVHRLGLTVQARQSQVFKLPGHDQAEVLIKDQIPRSPLAARGFARQIGGYLPMEKLEEVN